MNYQGAKTYILTRLRTELPERLFYHGYAHTLDVLRVATALCRSEGIKGQDAQLVKTASVYHDCGFLLGKHAGHEAAGCEIVRTVLPGFNYTPTQIDAVCGMIMATKIPQSPANLMQQIICDADLDYLGRDDFFFIGSNLFHELQSYNLIDTEENWNRLQVSFLSAHHFHTATNKTQREPVKQRYLESLKTLVASY